MDWRRIDELLWFLRSFSIRIMVGENGWCKENRKPNEHEIIQLAYNVLNVEENLSDWHFFDTFDVFLSDWSIIWISTIQIRFSWFLPLNPLTSALIQLPTITFYFIPSLPLSLVGLKNFAYPIGAYWGNFIHRERLRRRVQFRKGIRINIEGISDQEWGIFWKRFCMYKHAQLSKVKSLSINV